MIQVEFKRADAKKGYFLLLRAGTIVYTGKKGVYIVPEESVKALRRARVKFVIKPFSSNSGKNGK